MTIADIDFWERADLWVSLLTGVLAIIALLVTYLRGALFRFRRRRWLDLTGLSRDCAVDVVLTTSTQSKSEHGLEAMRPLTGLGQVRGLAQVARCMGGYLGNRPFSVFLSGFVTSDLNQHLVVLGGPAKNQLTKQLLHTEVPRILDDVDWLTVDDLGRVFQLGSDRYEMSDEDLIDEVPVRDIAMVVIAPNPLSSLETGASAIACLGMTTYGTEAAAELAFTTIRSWSRRRWASLGLARSSSGSRVVILVADVTIANGAVGSLRSVKAYVREIPQ